MKIITDIAYADLPRPFGLGDLYLPDELNDKTQLVLSIHGGGWSAGDRYSFSGVARFLCENGFAVFNIEYRLTGTAPWPACGEDCLTAAAFLQNSDALEPLRPIKDRRLITIGGSSGGHLALMTGLRMPKGSCRAILSLSGVDEHSGLMKYHPGCYNAFFAHQPPFTEKELYQSSPAAYLTPDAPPILLTHCIYDTVSDLCGTTAFEDAVRQNGTPVSVYYYNRKNDGHCIWIKDSAPHRLYPDIEEHIIDFLHNFSDECKIKGTQNEKN